MFWGSIGVDWVHKLGYNWNQLWIQANESPQCRRKLESLSSLSSLQAVSVDTHFPNFYLFISSQKEDLYSMNN